MDFVYKYSIPIFLNSYFFKLFSEIILEVYEVIINVFMCVVAVTAVEGDMFTPGLFIQ